MSPLASTLSLIRRSTGTGNVWSRGQIIEFCSTTNIRARCLGVKAFPPFPTDFLLPKVALLENTQMHFTRVLLYFSLGTLRMRSRVHDAFGRVGLCHPL